MDFRLLNSKDYTKHSRTSWQHLRTTHNTQHASCRKMGHLDRVLPKDGASLQHLRATHNMLPAERWGILTALKDITQHTTSCFLPKDGASWQHSRTWTQHKTCFPANPSAYSVVKIPIVGIECRPWDLTEPSGNKRSFHSVFASAEMHSHAQSYHW